jgi:hypothetical protein
MKKDFMPGDVIKITAMNASNEYAITISEKEFIEESGYSGEPYEQGSVFYKNAEGVQAGNATFLKLTDCMEKSSRKEAISDLGEQLKFIQSSLDFFKLKKDSELEILLPDVEMLAYIRENCPCTIKEIDNTSSLPLKYIKKSIYKLEKLGYLEVKNDKYFPISWC